jgi:hypothetical protein
MTKRNENKYGLFNLSLVDDDSESLRVDGPTVSKNMPNSENKKLTPNFKMENP